jgi:hypothetical protein
MATHDDAIVNRYRKRVLEFEKGKVVRDEQQGAYVEQQPARDDDLWGGYGGGYGGGPPGGGAGTTGGSGYGGYGGQGGF